MCILIVFLTMFYIVVRTKKNLHILQQNFYNENNRYIKWGNKNINSVFKIDILFIILNIINLYLKSKGLLFFCILYVFLFLLEFNRLKNEQVKIPLKITSRIKRLIITIIIIYLLPIIYLFNNIYIFSLIYSILISINFYILFIANIINKPIEKCVFLYYKNKAMKKIKNMNNLNVIGITGSYGKTSSKNILNDILSVKFNSLATPKNYNTQYGLILTINNYLDKFNDIFIAEMGAFKMGRIKLLCNLVKPKYGIITSIGTAHLETFGSQENIQKGKFELIESLPIDGLGILNMDDPYQVNYKLKNNCEIMWIGIENKNADILAKNIKMNSKGMEFDVYFKNEKETHTFKTKLLGNANIYNILYGIAFAKYMGMSYEEIKIGVSRIKPIAHRLELKNMGDYTIIDDAYNSNPVGSKMALDVLNLMDGLKIVVTPGMIELGSKQYELNKKFGQYISNVADYVILVGESQTKPILDGLKENKYNKENISIINDVKEAFIIIDKLKKANKHTYILLENDLPDIFNE
ncbi:MAG: UDP-N-acetylmuramoyl-tripeptide--D-alanyl-D-alanine ligase [Bacilli bacterium]|nr:UDP-N-acetylmuramoyl-tripeptide--D-alanyl-D-alanine ligase [Bacilli bacterium]